MYYDNIEGSLEGNDVASFVIMTVNQNEDKNQDCYFLPEVKIKSLGSFFFIEIHIS